MRITKKDIAKLLERSKDDEKLKLLIQYLFSFKYNINVFAEFFFPKTITNKIPNFHNEFYDFLFADYRQTTLLETKESQQEIINLLQKHKRIALTCFEAKPCQCHRTHLAETISKSPEFNYPTIHL